jgi:CheY-like chemotaxis protein
MKSTTVLYIDDDQDDLMLLKEAFQAIDPAYIVLQAPNGEEGIQKLHELQAENQLPCLIVLDINMPKMCGRQTFQHIKSTPPLAHIPIVIFSTSSNPQDKAFFEAQNVAYITKPINFCYLTEVAKQLIHICSSQTIKH